MNAQRLLQHFDRISEAPDAIPRLRQFILDLAVRGKLVEQDPNDEPAAELLKRIHAEKARLIQATGARQKSPPSAMAADEAPFPVPSGWQWSQLADIGLISPRNDADGATQASFVPMALIPADYGIPHTHEVRLWNEIKTGYTHFAEGDVGLAKITPCFENGKSTVFRGLTGGLGAGTTELHVVRPGLVNGDYVLLFLKSPQFIESGVPRMTGTAGQKRVSADYFAYSPFPLPPLAEQHRIVAKVDELMSLCDQLEAAKIERDQSCDSLVAASLHRLNQSPDIAEAEDAEAFRAHASFTLNSLPRLTSRPAHIKQLRQTILSLAVRGKLVPQDPRDEPASKLLKRIAADKALLVKAGKAKESKAGQTKVTSDEPFDIPWSWHWITLGELAHNLRYGTSAKCSYETVGVPVLRIPNIENGRINIEDLKFGPLPSREAEELRLRLGDILMVRSNGSLSLVGRPALVESHAVGFCYAGYLVRVRSSAVHLDARYVVLALNSAHVRGQIELPIRTTVGLKNVNATELSGLTIPLPPLAEQHRIVAKVDELMALCDQLEAQLVATEADSRRLLEAVLHEALAPAKEAA